MTSCPSSLAGGQNHNQIYSKAIPADYQQRRFSRETRGENNPVVSAQWQ
jgi:hypothetical protein